MGGMNSGRHGGSPTVESAKCITISQIMGKRQPGDRQGWHGSRNWTHVHTGEVTMTLRFETNLIGDRGWIDLEHQAARWGEAPQLMAYRIELEGVPQPFGGLRWFFVSPGTFAHAHKLFLPLGGLRFASRQAYKLGYTSQRNTVKDRAINQAWKARIALGGVPGEHPIGSYIPKRKWQHWRTYDRDVAALKAKEGLTTFHMLQTLAKWGNEWAMQRLVDLTSVAGQPVKTRRETRFHPPRSAEAF